MVCPTSRDERFAFVSAAVDKSGDRVREMFSEISARYDFLNHLLSGGTDFYWRWRTVRAFPPNGDGPILDVCTGTGDLAIAYWKKAAGHNKVIGTDFTPQMLQLAREKFSKLHRVNQAEVTFQEADTQNLPFEDDTFQLVSVAFGLRNVDDTKKGLAEMIRVCRPGGRVIILEFSLPESRIMRAMYLWYFRNILPKIGQWLMRNQQSAYNYLPASVAEFPYGRALADIMQTCGLTHVTWKPLTFGVVTLYCGKKPCESLTS